jgi:hypothetical protein
MENDRLAGPPKRLDRKFISAMIGVIAGLVLILIVFVFFSDFPGRPHWDGPDAAPPEHVNRAGP